VKTPDGDRYIEALRMGDAVFAYDFKTETVVVRPILRLHRNWTTHLVSIQTLEETIAATRGHRFWLSQEAKWYAAEDLQTQLALYSLTSGPVDVQSMDIHENVSTTYNIEVVDAKNYFVGSCGVLVHNGDGTEEFGFEESDAGVERESGLLNPERRRTRIYAVRDSNKNIVYIGKTFQGEEGDVITRFNQHLARKPEWRERGYTIDPEPLAEGDWTRFETAVWEQHLMNRHGGPRSENPATQLENKDRAITPEKFNEIRSNPDVTFNPCR
jgi:hypothetical protein